MRVVATDKAPPAAGPYSQAVVQNGTVYVSGQIPVDPSTGSMPEGAAAQARQALKNLRNVIEASGSSMDKVLKVTVYLKDMGSFADVNAVYAEFFSKPYPARSCVGCQDLPKGSLVEIDAVAYIG
ncbi:MAG: RidA family protein [Candidatus Methanomethylophilaceae archaeon]|nr:RidA family protein [Candidatus Methanomethylophilaceae archaeon]